MKIFQRTVHFTIFGFLSFFAGGKSENFALKSYLEDGGLPTFIFISEYFASSDALRYYKIFKQFPISILKGCKFSKNSVEESLEKFSKKSKKESIVKQNLIYIPASLDELHAVIEGISGLQSKIIKSSTSNYILHEIIVIFAIKVFNSSHEQSYEFFSNWRAFFGSQVKFHLNSNVYIFVPSTDSSSTGKLFELYGLGNHINYLQYLTPTHFGKKLQTRTSLHNLTLNVVASNLPGNIFQAKIIYVNDTLQLESGLNRELTHFLMDSLNFSINVIIESIWPNLNAEGEWIGMGKHLIEGTGDFVISQNAYLTIRAKSFAIMVPLPMQVASFSVFFLGPPSNSGNNFYFDPFSRDYWILLFTMSIIFVGFTNTTVYLKHYYSINFNCEMNLCTDSFMWMITFICQKGWYESPYIFYMRVTLFSAIFMCVISYSCYSAILFSFLSKPTTPIGSIEELLQKTITLYVDNGSLTVRRFFKGEEGEASIFNKIESQNLILSSVEKATKGMDLNYATNPHEYTGLFCYDEDFYYMSRFKMKKEDKEICRVHSVPAITGVRHSIGMLLRKNSQYIEFFNAKLLVLIESGLMKRYQMKYKESIVPLCPNTIVNAAKDLGIRDLLLLYLIISFGYIASVLIVMQEIVYKSIAKYTNVNLFRSKIPKIHNHC